MILFKVLLIVSVSLLFATPIIQAWYESTLDFVADRALNQQKDYCKYRHIYFLIAGISSIILLCFG